MFLRLAHLVSCHPRRVLACWLLLISVALPLAARVGQVLNAQPEAPAGSIAAAIRDLIGSSFDQQSDYLIVLVTHGVGTRVGEAKFDRAYAEVKAKLSALPGIATIQDYQNATGLPLVGSDGSYTVTILGLKAPTLLEAKSISHEIREQISGIDSLRFNLAGGPATAQELEAISERDARRAELFGLPLSLLVLIVAFGALVASMLPLMVAIISISVSFAILYLLGQVIEFAVFTQSVVTMLGLATGIDYALLMVNRFREELRRKGNSRRAAEATALTAGKSVAFSGMTVVVALSALLLPPLDFIRSIGIGTMVVLIVSVSVSITALPACLALLGERVNWLKVTRREPGLRSRPFWRERALIIMKRPLMWTIGGGLVLLLLSIPAIGMQVADPGPLGLSAHTDAKKAFSALQSLGIEGMLRPFDVLVDFGENSFFHPSSVRATSRFTRQLKTLNNVETVYSPLGITAIPRLLLFQYYASMETALRSELADLVRATVSRDGRYVLIRVFAKGDITPRQGGVIRREIAETAAGLGLSARIGGEYVLESEWTQVLYRSFPLALALVYLITIMLLGLAFGSLLIPLKAIILNTLTVGAAYGIITLVFQYGLFASLLGLGAGIGFVDNSAPLFIFAIVFGLSMDYEIFLVARIFEAHKQGMNDHDAVVAAMSATGGVITSAATVMVMVFSSFIFSGVMVIKTLGIGLTVAIILDATLVRLALVPAMILLAGRWNWWLPLPIARLARRVNLSHD